MSLNCFASIHPGVRHVARGRLLGALGMLLLAGCATPTGGPGAPSVTADGRFDQAAAAMRQGPQEQALALLDDLAAEYPMLPEPWINKGILHAAAGRDDHAEKALLRAIEIMPQHAIAHAELGIVLRRLGRFAEADTAYRTALELEPDYALAWRNRGVLLDLYLGRPTEALECYERYLELVGGVEADDQVARWVTELRLRTDTRVATR